MLIGEYTHTLDSKKRISLPAKFRKELGKKVVMSRGLDTCVFLYPLAHWQIISEQLGELGMGSADSRKFSRFMLASAQDVEIDSAGRILVPDFLKDFANLKTKVVLAGIYNRVEIWNDKAWNEYKKQMQKQADGLAEKFGDLGML